MRFEKYRNTLIPIERVMWIEFKNKGDWMENEPSTFVHLFLPNGFTQAIKFKGNQVDKINEWLRQFPDAGSCASGAVPSIRLPEHRETPDTTWNTDGTDAEDIRAFAVEETERGAQQ